MARKENEGAQDSGTDDDGRRTDVAMAPLAHRDVMASRVGASDVPDLARYFLGRVFLGKSEQRSNRCTNLSRVGSAYEDTRVLDIRPSEDGEVRVMRYESETIFRGQAQLFCICKSESSNFSYT